MNKACYQYSILLLGFFLILMGEVLGDDTHYSPPVKLSFKKQSIHRLSRN